MKVKIPSKNKTLCILANTKVGDVYGGRIMNSLKKDFGLTDLTLVGNGGENLRQHGLNKSVFDLNDLREKFLYLWRHSTKQYNNSKHSSSNMYQISLRMNNNILNLIDENKVVESIVNTRPSCIVNLENEHLSQELAVRFNQIYGYKKGASSNIRPDNYLLTKEVRHLVPEHEALFTEGFYTYALEIVNKRYYTFPSHYIGQYGAYDALRFLYQKGGMENRVLDEHQIVVSQNSLHDIETCRTKISDEFREKNNIDKNATVIFFAPGNTIGENEYTLEDFRKGYNEYISKYTYPSSLSFNAPPKEMFKLVVSVQKGTDSEKYIRDFIQGSKYNTDVIIVDNENNKHFEAICASDFGFVYNGQLLSSAAVLHLNVITMQDMNDLHYYWHTWENRWLADININADRPIIPEFAAGEFWFGKIANKLAEMHTNTELKWDQVRGLRPFIPELLSYKSTLVNGLSEINKGYIDGQDLVVDAVFEDPIHIMSKKIVNSMQNYKNPIAVKPDIEVLRSIPSITLNNDILKSYI